MHAPKIVTTSWDDGDPRDLKIAELLRARRIKGTFYIPLLGYDGLATLDPAGLRSLDSEGFEIGAHGLSHHTLPKFRGKELAREVSLPKRRLEDLLGREVSMFAYPKGRYNANVIRQLKLAGYAGARTTEMLGYRLDFRPFEMSTTIHAYPHSNSSYLRNVTRAFNFGRGLHWLARFRGSRTWVELGKRFFDSVLKDGGVWHLYGHSWAIDDENLWNDLTELLDYVSEREGVLYKANREVLKFLPISTSAVMAKQPDF